MRRRGYWGKEGGDVDLELVCGSPQVGSGGCKQLPCFTIEKPAEGWRRPRPQWLEQAQQGREENSIGREGNSGTLVIVTSFAKGHFGSVLRLGSRRN